LSVGDASLVLLLQLRTHLASDSPASTDNAGTDESTMSILTLRRVQDWQGGIGGLVSKWEKL
jgi:hypothetical protein